MVPVPSGTPGNEMSIDEVELVCGANDDIEALRGKLNKDPEKALWTRTFAEHFEVGDDFEDLDPENFFRASRRS